MQTKEKYFNIEMKYKQTLQVNYFKRHLKALSKALQKKKDIIT